MGTSSDLSRTRAIAGSPEHAETLLRKPSAPTGLTLPSGSWSFGTTLCDSSESRAKLSVCFFLSLSLGFFYLCPNHTSTCSPSAVEGWCSVNCKSTSGAQICLFDSGLFLFWPVETVTHWRESSAGSLVLMNGVFVIRKEFVFVNGEDTIHSTYNLLWGGEI